MYYVNPVMLSYLLTGSYPPTRAILHSLVKGIKELGTEQIITLSQSERVNEWIVDTSVMDESGVNNYYTAIEETNVTTILLSNESHCGNVVSLLRFYIYLLSTVHKKGNKVGVGFTSLTHLSDATDLNVKTVNTYLTKLEELELIYVHRSKESIKFDSGEIREISPTYGEYKNKDKIIRIGKEYENAYSLSIKEQHKKILRANGNATRSASHKYNHLVKCINEGIELSENNEYYKEIYIAMVEYNKKYEHRKERIKDLSIFSRFDFYKNDTKQII